MGSYQARASFSHAHLVCLVIKVLRIESGSHIRCVSSQ